MSKAVCETACQPLSGNLPTRNWKFRRGSLYWLPDGRAFGSVTARAGSQKS